MANELLSGVIRGKTIELTHEPSLPDGQRVSVTIRPEEDPPWWLERLDVDPSVRKGKLIVKGTLLLAEDLADLVEAGRTDEELARQFPELTPEDLAAIREYVRVPAGLRRAFGGWAEDEEEVDRFIEWTYQQRQLESRPLDL